MTEPRHHDRVVGFIGGKIWYRVEVSVDTAARAIALATADIGPPWRRDIDLGITGVRFETTDPEWFLELERKMRMPRAY